MNNLVSVNIVTHNREKYIEEAVGSVLIQDYNNWEIIIIDDASTDNTALIVEQFLSDKRIKYYIVEKQKNISVVRNIALSKSKGKYVAVLDSDDIWNDKTKLSRQVEFLESNPEFVLVGSAANIINDHGIETKTVIKPVSDEDIRKVFLTKNPFFHSSVMFVKKTVEELSGYKEDLSYGEDLDLCLRLGKMGKLYNFPDPMIQYRTHEGNEATKHPGGAILDVFRIINKNRKNYGFGRSIYLKKIFGKFFEKLAKKN